MNDCPCYPECEVMPNGKCLRQAIIEVVLKEQERAHELSTEPLDQYEEQQC